MVPAQQQPLTYEERNALHYTAGAVYRTLKKCLTKSKHPSKGDLCGDDDDEDDENDAKKWEELIDRGGLCHVKDETSALSCIGVLSV